jgi:hypothetical protein
MMLHKIPTSGKVGRKWGTRCESLRPHQLEMGTRCVSRFRQDWLEVEHPIPLKPKPGLNGPPSFIVPFIGLHRQGAGTSQGDASVVHFSP